MKCEYCGNKLGNKDYEVNLVTYHACSKECATKIDRAEWLTVEGEE